MPILDPVLIEALESWLEFRIENHWGVTSTDYLDLESPFFLQSREKGFVVRTTDTDDVIRHNADSINRILRQRIKDNGLSGSVDSALRTWTLLAIEPVLI